GRSYRGQLLAGGRLAASLRGRHGTVRAARHPGRPGRPGARDRLPGGARRNRANEQERNACRSSRERHAPYGSAAPPPCARPGVAALGRNGGGRSGPRAERDGSGAACRAPGLAPEECGGFSLDGITEPDVIVLRQLAGGEVVIEITQLAQQLAT